MCGIIAAINSSAYSKENGDFLSNGLIAGAVRGQDSTGIVQVCKKGKIYTHKLAVSGGEFLADKTTLAFIKDANVSPINIVHHRAATVGVINDDNAHPFICDTGKENGNTKKQHILVGVHNGSLVNWKNKPDAKDFTVDSHWALSHIAKHGLAAFKDIDGPYCFMWTTTENPDKLFVVRNSGRPMHAVFTKDRTEVYFASEAGMLAWLCERNRIVTEDHIMVLGTDKLYEFDTSGAKVTVTATDLPARPVVVAHPQNTYTNYGRRTPQHTVLNDEGKKFIDKVKAAANYDPATAHAVPDLTKPLIDTDKVAAAIADDIPWDSSNDGEFVADTVPTDWFSDRNATAAEKEEAKKWGMFRELQWFQGIAYDDQTGEVLGDVEIWDKVNGKVKYTGVIRGCSQARANSEYIREGLNGSTDGNWVVVIGAREEKQLGKVLVVAELNQAGRAGLERISGTH